MNVSKIQTCSVKGDFGGRRAGFMLFYPETTSVFFGGWGGEAAGYGVLL